MSRTLHCDFYLDSEKSPIYWWPLIFDAMQQHAFQFSAPGLPKGTGRYFYVRHVSRSLEDVPDSGLVTGTFKDLWNEIYLVAGDVIVSFWSAGEKPFLLEVLVSPGKDKRAVSISLTLEGAEVMDLSASDIQSRLGLVLDCAKAIYSVSGPAQGEMYWLYAGDRNAPWVSFGTSFEAPSFKRPVHEGPQRKIIHQELPDGGQMYLLDPVPVPKGGGWNFISLLSSR